MNKPKVLITRRWPEQVEAKLQALYDTTLNATDQPMSTAELQQALRDYDAVLPTVSDKITAEVLSIDNARTQILGNFGVGFSHIDLEAAKALDLTITNTPDVLTDATADLALTLILMVARRAGEGERHLRSLDWSGWRPTHMMGSQVTGKTLGIIGMGRIACATAERAQFGFGMDIIYYNRSPVPAERLNKLKARACASAEEVLAQADFVSLHCPGGARNKHLINAERLAAMQNHAYLINTARGDVVDEQALVDALNNKTIAGAGLDVYEAEPSVHPELLNMNNVVLLPHLGSATLETRTAMGMRVVENVQAFFARETPPDKVL